MSEPLRPAAFRAAMIERHRPAFQLWQRTCAFVEASVQRPRDISSPYARAIDLLFLQGYKSFCSLYILTVRGHGEDAATILRRLLEISWQAGFVAADADERESRAKRFLAYYWAQVPDLLKQSVDMAARTRLQSMYDAHKHLLAFDHRGRVRNWWCGSIRDLADRLGLVATYDQDYSFLSQMAHGTTQGILLGIRSDGIEIRSDQMVPEILVFGCRYILGVTLVWNEQFNLCSESERQALAAESLNYRFHPEGGRDSGVPGTSADGSSTVEP